MREEATVFAPGRIEVLGNHTDYNQGCVLSAAIQLGVTASGKCRGDSKVRVVSDQDEAVVEFDLDAEIDPACGGWQLYVEGVARVMREAGWSFGGFEARLDSTLPRGAGLSSSAALEVAVGRLIVELYGLEVPPMELARLCCRAENEIVGVKCGLLDQVSSVFGQEGALVYLDCLKEEVRHVPWPEGLRFVVMESGNGHSLVDGQYNLRREQCDAAARAAGVEAMRHLTWDRLEALKPEMEPLLWKRAAHVVGENARVARAVEVLQAGDTAGFGRLLNESHQSSMENFENSTPDLDALVALARREASVRGARLTGGGFGGAIIALVEGDDQTALEVAENVRKGYLESGGPESRSWICRIWRGAHVVC